MAIKVLVTAIGQQLIADVKQVENKNTKEVVAYWVKNPRVVTYNQTEDGNVNVGFLGYCLVSDENEFSITANHIVSILEPLSEVVDKYDQIVNPPEPEETVLNEVSSMRPEDELSTDSVESGDSADISD